MTEIEKQVSTLIRSINIGDEVVIRQGEGQPACAYDTNTIICFKIGSILITVEGVIISKRTVSGIKITGNKNPGVIPSIDAVRINDQLVAAGEFNRRTLG